MAAAIAIAMAVATTMGVGVPQAKAEAAAQVAAPPGATSFIGCPIYRDTDAGRKSGCWLVDDPATGVRYDVSLAPTLPQVGHEVLVEGVAPQAADAAAAAACGGVVLRPVRTAVIATQCPVAEIPAEGFPGRRYVLPADVMQQSWVPRPVPSPPYSTQQYVLLFNFGDDRLIYQYAENILERAAAYAKASDATVHVSGYAATQTLIVSGRKLVENVELAKSRAGMVAEALARLGVDRSRQRVEWHGAAPLVDVPAAALPENTRRRVVITVEPRVSVAAATAAPRAVDSTLASGALWAARVPANWNGTLLLYSHGYAPSVRAPELAPRGLESWLLEHGYALAASSYSAAGWALAEAVPDQLATLDAFTAQFGAPRRTIAWGNSMGGLVTVALAEQQPTRLDGALPSCGSIAGSLGMMNLALDGAFAFKTLLAPDSAIELVHVTDDRANAARVATVLADALATPAGRARLALASALAQLPGWTDPEAPEPAASDAEAQLQEIARTFAMGVFLPRTDQEQRAGGAFSWNTGIDYRRQLALSGRSAWVGALYRKAGLSVEQDLARLNAASRVTADPAAVAYMRANYVPNGLLSIPMLSFHTTGDGLTMVTLQGAYESTVRTSGRSQYLRTAWLHGAGHCTFTPAENVAALRALEERLASGHWQTSAAHLNALAAASGLEQGATGTGRFVAFKPAPFLRPCSRTGRACQGEPR